MFAEDDDDLFGGTTPSPRSSAGDQSITVMPTQSSIQDFKPRTHQNPETSLEMTRPPRPKTQRVTPLSYTEAPSTTAAPPTDPTVETTTVPITAATTEDPDPDAQVCSGRPFDSFMQVKNGSIYAFRGEGHVDVSHNLTSI